MKIKLFKTEKMKQKIHVKITPENFSMEHLNHAR